jgi:hypothetical protein
MGLSHGWVMVWGGAGRIPAGPPVISLAVAA